MSTQSDLGEFENRTVFVNHPSGAIDVYHTDDECQHLRGNQREIPLEIAKQRDLTECKLCSGDVGSDNLDHSNLCGAATIKGGPCKTPALVGFDRCSRHLGEPEHSDTSSDDVEADRPVWERQRAEVLGDD